LQRLSHLDDPFRGAADFETFHPGLNAALSYSDGSLGSCAPFDPVMKLKILVIQAAKNLSDERAELLISDRLSLMRFVAISLSQRVPDAHMICCLGRLTKAGAIPAGPRFQLIRRI
jgi:transposase, IS5 family